MLVIYVIVLLLKQNPHLAHSLALYLIYSLIGNSIPCTKQAKFLAVLIIVPWAMDFLVHDYILMPFLDRYLLVIKSL